MGFWSSYRSSLKSLDVEEPIDVWVHRPLAYFVAKACYPLLISPDAVTVLSMVVGVGGAVVLISPMAGHAWAGALMIFLSTILDCADGQLARLRGSSSAWGRMLDGVADLFTVGALVPATLAIVCRGHEGWRKVGLLTLGATTVVTTAFQTAMYDHYKNVFVRLGRNDRHEGSSDAWPEVPTHVAPAPVVQLVRHVYAFYVRAQQAYLARFDPCGPAAARAFGASGTEGAAIYRRCASPAMGIWRTLFGTGSLMFGLALGHALRRPDLFLLYRLSFLNAVFYFVLRPMQRGASREALSRVGASPALEARPLPS